MFLKKEPQMEGREVASQDERPLLEEKEKKPRSKSRFFYPDTYYKDKRWEETKDPDIKAFYRDKW